LLGDTAVTAVAVAAAAAAALDLRCLHQVCMCDGVVQQFDTITVSCRKMFFTIAYNYFRGL